MTIETPRENNNIFTIFEMELLRFISTIRLPGQSNILKKKLISLTVRWSNTKARNSISRSLLFTIWSRLDGTRFTLTIDFGWNREKKETYLCMKEFFNSKLSILSSFRNTHKGAYMELAVISNFLITKGLHRGIESRPKLNVFNHSTCIEK